MSVVFKSCCSFQVAAVTTTSVKIVFFFQAEDGIRDYKVTGVQTCALPISAVAKAGHPRDHAGDRPAGHGRGRSRRRRGARGGRPRAGSRRVALHRRHAGPAPGRGADARPPRHPGERRRRRPAGLGARRRGAGPRHDRRGRTAGIGRGRAAAGLVVGTGRGAPARGVQHRTAGPRRRRPTARLPAHARGHRHDRAAWPLPGAGRSVTDGTSSSSNEGVSAPSAPDAAAAEGTAGGPGAHVVSPGWSGTADEHPPEPGGACAPQHMASAARLAPVHPQPRRDAWDAGAAITVRRRSWPASRRARALARRRARTLATPAATAAVPAGAGAPRRPAVPRLRRRRRILLAGIGMLTAAGVALAVAGVTLVRHSTAGRYIEGAGPDDPGYEAFVVPTPVMDLFQTGDDGELVGVAVLALESRDGNGSVVLVAPSMLAGPAAPEGSLAATYRDGGAEGVAAVLADLLAMAIPEHLEVDDARWASLVRPVAPLELQLDEPVGEWRAGDHSPPAPEGGPLLSALAAGQDDADRVDRPGEFWA